MKQLKLKDNPESVDRLSKAASAVEDFLASHPNELSDEEHDELRSLLSDRASALSEATGLLIHSICD